MVVSIFAPHCNRGIWRLWSSSDAPPPSRTLTRASNAGGYEKSRFSTNTYLALSNDTRESHSYHGTRIGNRIRSIEWCYFQWLWMTFNPDFKVTPIFDTEYVSGSALRYTYLGLQWITRPYTSPTHRCNFEWHLTTLSDLAKFITTSRGFCDRLFLLWVLLLSASALPENCTATCFWQRVRVRVRCGKVFQPWRNYGGNWNFPVTFAYLIYW